MPKPDGVSRPRLSRRDLLRRGAVVGGLIWTAPVIQSVASPAFAASPEYLSCCQCGEAPGFESKVGPLTCADCRAYCAGHKGVKVYARGTDCISADKICVPTDHCPKVPCAWQGTGPVELEPIR